MKLAIVTGYNSPPRNPRDASAVFRPESAAWAKLHKADRYIIEDRQTDPKRRVMVEDEIRQTHLGDSSPLEALAFFGHGTESQLILSGHTIATIDGLVRAIKLAADGEEDLPLDIVLYACLTASGTKGLSDILSDRLSDTIPKVHVYSHTKAGHATWNPFVELAGGPDGGDPIFLPAEGGPWRIWRERLRDKTSSAFRLSFYTPGTGLPRKDALEAIRAEALR